MTDYLGRDLNDRAEAESRRISAEMTKLAQQREAQKSPAVTPLEPAVKTTAAAEEKAAPRQGLRERILSTFGIKGP